MEQIVTIDNELDLIWRLASDRELLYRGWDDESVVYNHCSGDTHLLDGTAMRLLLALQTGPLPGPDLARAVGIGGETFVALLADLESLCLIVPNEC
jgi:PqqD family protein of HPr-rel-A system